MSPLHRREPAVLDIVMPLCLSSLCHVTGEMSPLHRREPAVLDIVMPLCLSSLCHVSGEMSPLHRLEPDVLDIVMPLCLSVLYLHVDTLRLRRLQKKGKEVGLQMRGCAQAKSFTQPSACQIKFKGPSKDREASFLSHSHVSTSMCNPLCVAVVHCSGSTGEGAYATVNLCVLLAGASLNRSFSLPHHLRSSLVEGKSFTAGSARTSQGVGRDSNGTAASPAADMRPMVAVKCLKPVGHW